MSEAQSHESPSQPEPASHLDRQRRVEALADEHLERLLAGETPDRRALVAAHPDLADLLEPRLALVELMHRVAKAERPAPGQAGSVAPPGVPAERGHHVKCPHCGNAIQLVEPAPGEVTCNGCGSSFRLDAGATTDYRPAALPPTVGKFEVLEQLGRGAFGTVYKARDPQLQRLVAVKVPRAGSFATPEEEERFLREARAAAQLSHPGIVPVLEVAHDRGVPYIVSEYVEGLTLADVLTGRRPGFREAAELTAAVADALDYAHRRQVVHRDVKPSNLLLDAAGRPHVTDFGLARRGEGEITVTLDGQVLGTPAYMAPEQAAGDQRRVDARSDVYSLGVVLYEMLTGELPFRGNQRMLLHQVLHDEPRPPRSLNDRIPRDLETICLKAMAKAPARRYASAREMADDLRRFLNGEPIRARPVGRAEKLGRWARRNPVVATLTTAVALLLVAVAAVAISFALYQRQANSELADQKAKAEKSQREAEVREASARVDLDLKHCDDGEIEYGVLRLARTLGELPAHATDLRQCVEMNLFAWAQEIRPLGPTFQYDGAETKRELSPDGLTVLSGGADGTARLWDAFTGEVRATLRGHRGEITELAFSQNGRVVMTVGKDRTVRFWGASNGQAPAALAEHPKIEQKLLSPDGRRLLTIYHETPVVVVKHQEPGGSLLWSWTNSDNCPPLKNTARVILWDTATGKRISDLAGHEGQVNDGAFSADGQVVLTGGADKTARLWSAENGRPLTTLNGHTGMVVSVAISPDGSLLATLDNTGCVRWWDSGGFQQIMPPCASSAATGRLRFIHADVAVLDGWEGPMGSPHSGTCYIRGSAASIEFPRCSTTNCGADESYVIDPQGWVYDRKSGKRLPVPEGQRFVSKVLTRFAIAGRFIVRNEFIAKATHDDIPGWLTLTGRLSQTGTVTDLRTEKRIGALVTTWGLGEPRYVSARQSFVVQAWPSLRYIPIPGVSLEAEVARLFAEVVSCRRLDPAGTTQLLPETEWEERRRKLQGRLGEHSSSPLVRRVATDRWHWLRRQVDRAKSDKERIKYLDRLIAVEPTWQNYELRAIAVYGSSKPPHYRDAAADFLEAGKRAGGGYWHRELFGPFKIDPFQIAANLLMPATGRPEDYQVGLRLAQAYSNAKPEDRSRRDLLAIAHYRVGHYREALTLLENWRRERERAVVAQVGQFLMRPWPGPFFTTMPIPRSAVPALVFEAMAHHRLGHSNVARAVLVDLRTAGTSSDGRSEHWSEYQEYTQLLREAEALIEGRPRPKK